MGTVTSDPGEGDGPKRWYMVMSYHGREIEFPVRLLIFSVAIWVAVLAVVALLIVGVL